MKAVINGHYTGGFRLANLKNIRKRAQKTQEEVARDLGIVIGTYRNWEQQNNNPSPDNMARLASYFDCTANDLILVGSEPGNIAYEMTDAPLFGRIAAGTPLEMGDPENWPDNKVQIPSAVMDEHPDSFLLTVTGNSMNRVLPNGCYALIDPNRKEPVIDNRAYAVCVNGYDATIKRVHKLANGFELVPDSTDPTYKPKVYDYGEPGTDVITILGEVVWYTIPYDFEI